MILQKERELIPDKIDRIEATKPKLFNGCSAIIFTDTKTGREFLAYNHAIIEITPKGE